jgi:hypothetical protein
MSPEHGGHGGHPARFTHKSLKIKAKWVTLISSLLPRFQREKTIWHLPARKVTAISSLRELIADTWNVELALR